MTIQSPFEILELEDGGTLQTKIKSWEVGEVTIHPSYAPQGKNIKALRIHVPETDKEFFPYYWDVTSQTLIAQMQPYLESDAYDKWLWKITKHGTGPRARFSLEVKPS